MPISMAIYQQINMYQPVFRRQRKIFSAATLLKITAVTLVLLLALYVQARWKLHGLQRTSDNLTLNYRQLDARLGKLEASGKTTVGTPPGEDIVTLQEQVSKRRVLLERIDRLSVDTAAGFGDIFEALARQDVPGLWLTGVRLDQGGNIEIRGATLDPGLVPRYLQLMAQQTRLAVLNNGTVNLTRHTPDRPEIDFILSYRAREETH